MDITNKIICGDSMTVLKEIPDESFHCVVTSPPYDGLRTYSGYLDFDFEKFKVIAGELYRVMVQGGIVCWNVGDATIDGSETLTSFRQALWFKDVGFKMHDTMIYEKNGFAKPSSNRYHQLFEYIFVLCKGKLRTFNPIKDKKNSGSIVGSTNSMRQKDGTMKAVKKNRFAGEFGMRGNIWRGNTSSQEAVCTPNAHPATMPKWLARDLIISWSNAGDLILDPFSGSGTTACIAKELGRNYCGIELNPEYVAMSEARLLSSQYQEKMELEK